MIAESPVNPPRNRPQTARRPDEQRGRESDPALRQPPQDGDFPTDDAERTVGTRDSSNASFQESPEVDIDGEESFWETAHQDQPYAGEDDLERYATAYRIGYEGYQRLGAEYSFEDVEEDLQEEYEGEGSSLPWERAREATRAAWDRLEARRQGIESEVGETAP